MQKNAQDTTALYRFWGRNFVSLCPIFWKFLLRRYFSIFVLSTFAIVLVLLSSRLEEIAHFIALGSSTSTIFLFILYQIPYILQIAFPIAAFIAGYTLTSRMSGTAELTALRSTGKSLSGIFRPVFVAAALCSLITFSLLFNLAAKSHLAAKKLEYDVRAAEPLMLLQSGQFLDDHGISLELSGSLKKGSEAKNILLCSVPKGQNRLALIVFSDASISKKSLEGSDVAIFSTIESTDAAGQSSHMTCIEQAAKKWTPTTYLHEMTQTKKWKVGAEHMSMPVLLATKVQTYKDLSVEKYEGDRTKNLAKKYGRFTTEPWRRASLALSITTLSYLGIILGIRIGRTRKLRYTLLALFSFSAFMAMYLMGKTLDELPYIACPIFVLSHVFAYAIATLRKCRIEAGTG